MKSALKMLVAPFPFIIVFMVLPNLSSGWTWQATCPDVLERGHLNVLTINLLFSEIKDRQLRLERIADYLEEEEDDGEPVDVVLLQEVVGGAFAGTVNSSLDLRNLLARRGLNYNLRYRLANGFPGLLSVGIAVLSRCQILLTTARSLPFVTEEPFAGLEVPLRRKAMMCRIKIPGYGKIHMYNVHLCAFCDIAERLFQTYALLDFVDDTERLIWGTNPIILGGDFNIEDARIPSDAPEYDAIVGAGFTDTYASDHMCMDAVCCDPDSGAGCTFAVPGNPYAVNLFTGLPEAPVRIDYIFAKGFAPGDIIGSTVVLNSDSNWVSDHSAVKTRFALP
jgi:maltose 6'-phosphate phosphatase